MSASQSQSKKSVSTLYPQYIDATLLPSEGRRLTKSQSVANPSPEEMACALAQLGYRNVIVNPSKSYPRAQGNIKYAVVPRGCVYVAIKDPANLHYIRKSEFDTEVRGPVVSGIESKQELLRRVAALIKATGAPREERPSIQMVLVPLTQTNTKNKKISA